MFTPQALNRRGSDDWPAWPWAMGIIGFGCWSKYMCGSTKAMSLPPRRMNWSSAYSARSEMSRGWITSNVFIAGSMVSALMLMFLTSKSRLSSLASTQGSVGARDIMLNGAPSTGKALITPITGRSVAATRARARIRSYSSRRSRCGLMPAMASLRSRRDTVKPR